MVPGSATLLRLRNSSGAHAGARRGGPRSGGRFSASMAPCESRRRWVRNRRLAVCGGPGGGILALVLFHQTNSGGACRPGPGDTGGKSRCPRPQAGVAWIRDRQVGIAASVSGRRRSAPACPARDGVPPEGAGCRPHGQQQGDAKQAVAGSFQNTEQPGWRQCGKRAGASCLHIPAASPVRTQHPDAYSSRPCGEHRDEDEHRDDDHRESGIFHSRR
jgi:hypothetical protein